MHQGVFAAGDQATGLGWLRPGFGFTDEDDRLWALGWPHLYVLVPGDATEKQRASSAAYARAFDAHGREMPAGMAVRTLRYYTALPRAEELVTAVNNTTELTDGEVEDIVRIAVRSNRGQVVVFVLEALRSSAEVATLVVAALDAISDADWKDDRPVEAFAGSAIKALHFVMLRMAAPDVDALRGRIAALADRVERLGVDPQIHRGLRALRFVLEPAPVNHWYLEFLTPDHAATIQERIIPVFDKMKPADRELGDPRLAFLGGEPVIEAFARNALRFQKDHREAIVHGMTRCAHPAVVDLMKAINSTRAKKWLKAHGHA
jgi:hypothetical protein